MIERNSIQKKVARLFHKGHFDWLPAEIFIRIQYWARMGKKANLSNPKLFTEKLAWLKLYDHNPRYFLLADKYEVKKYVSQTIGEEYVIPVLGVWNSFEDIDFNALPKQFVLKCTHDSGSCIVCKDKGTFNIGAARKRITASMSRNYYARKKEYAYKGVKPRIIAEKYISSLGHPDSIEYKFTCFDGVVGFGTICRGIAHSTLDVRTNDTYDKDFNFMAWHAYYNNSGIKWEKPEQWDRMVEFSERLSKGIPQIRVDWYVSDKKIYFGEFTFYTWGGHIDFEPEEWNAKLGNYIVLPQKHKERP